MKLISFRHGATASYGLLVGEGGIVDLGRRLGQETPSLKALLVQDRLSEVAAFAGERPDLRLSDVQLLPVIPDPDNILCVGLNYEEHRLETKRPEAKHPTIFMRVRESLQADAMPLIIPIESDQFDYEGELAVVIGKGGRRITEDDAWSHVAGVSCFNDGTVREWQYHTHQFGPGKNFPLTGSFGPALVTVDELPADKVMSLETRVNGQVVQHATTGQMIFSVPRLIAYCSTFMTLNPGDVIVTGTPGGVGAKRNPPLWLKPGDTVEVEIGAVGLLKNVCMKES